LIHFSFLPLKKFTTDILNSLEMRYELEEVISLSSVDELKLFISLFGAKLTQSALSEVENVDVIWVLSGKFKVLSEVELDSFYQDWLRKSQRDNNMDEFCQLVSFNSFLITLNKGKHKVVLQNS
jgi:hypothetical protein